MYSIGDYGDMIADKARMDPFVYALKALVKPDTVVLDIGTGTGIHALLACKFGARKVYAIEPNDAIHLASKLAQVNGFADRIEFIQDLSTNVTLPEQADLIVSDLRGVLPFFGGHIPAVIDARERHLAPGGQLISKKDRVWVAMVEAHYPYQGIVRPWDHPYGLKMEETRQIVLNNWYEEYTDTFTKRSFLTEPGIWAEIDYMSVDETDASATVTEQAIRDGTAHGLLVWFDGEIADGIHISNGPLADKKAEVYGCGFFPLLEPVQIAKGDRIRVDISANLNDETYIWNWHTRIHSGDDPLMIKADFQQATSNNAENVSV